MTQATRAWAGALALIAATWIAPCIAQDAADAGLVNQVAGQARYSAEGAPERPVQAFMKVRPGDRFMLAPGASVRIVFFEGNRQESWTGPAAFRVAPGRSDPLSGQPLVATLPSAVSLRMAKLPDLIQSARLGGVTVRGPARRPPPTAEEQAEVSQAHITYKLLRAEASADDITPELYLMSVLQEAGQYEQMTPLLDELAKRKPLNPEVEELVQWVRSRQ
jgi:hypothetical protein